MTISDKALAQLKEIQHVPQSVGYTHEIAELDNARLIRWESGWGYIASDAGLALLASQFSTPNLDERHP